MLGGHLMVFATVHAVGVRLARELMTTAPAVEVQVEAGHEMKVGPTLAAVGGEEACLRMQQTR